MSKSINAVVKSVNWVDGKKHAQIQEVVKEGEYARNTFSVDYVKGDKEFDDIVPGLKIKIVIG